MRNMKAFYEIHLDKRDEILEAIEKAFSLKPTFIDDYISMRGGEGSGIETVRMSLEKDVIKVLVVLYNQSLLEKFNSILGNPTKVRGRL
ncbi:MAG: hypothetical protein OEV85_10885 [Candidatus Thorarchaeota archaeon]|nr:hypothetical protein [Candidatus Thorarchaeota archaeon]